MYRLFLTLITAACVISATLMVGRCETGPAPAAPHEWTVDPGLASGLKPVDTTLGRCRLNLPPGWKLNSSQNDSGKPEVYAIGQDDGDPSQARTVSASSDSNIPAKLTITNQIADTAGPSWTPEKALDDALQDCVSHMAHVSKTSVEHGTVQGNPAVRCYLKGDYDAPGSTGGRAEAHAFAYVIGNKDLSTALVAFDVAPHHKTTLPLLERAVLTVKLTDTPKPVAPSTPESWKPNDKYLSSLGEEENFDGVLLRAPKLGKPAIIPFHNPNTNDDDPNIKTYVWTLDGKQHAELTMKIHDYSENESKPTLDDLIAELTQQSLDKLPNGAHSDPDRSTTAFGETVRIYANGSLKQVPEYTVLYGFTTPTKAVYFKASDWNDPDKTWLKTFETVILSGHLAPNLQPVAPPVNLTPDMAPDQAADPSQYQYPKLPEGTTLHDYIFRHGQAGAPPPGPSSQSSQ